MRAVSILSNLGLSLFTAFVLVTDGLPTEVRFIALSLFVLLVPGLTALVLHRPEALRTPSGRFVHRGTLLANVLLLGWSCWAVVTQYPSHPEEPGLLPYALLTLLAPLLGLVALGRGLQRSSGGPTPAG